jgi:hypothetical protein
MSIHHYMMDGRFVPYGGLFWGRRRETAPKNRFRGTVPAWMAGTFINTWRVIYDN